MDLTFFFHIWIYFAVFFFNVHPSFLPKVCWYQHRDRYESLCLEWNCSLWVSLKQMLGLDSVACGPCHCFSSASFSSPLTFLSSIIHDEMLFLLSLCECAANVAHDKKTLDLNGANLHPKSLFFSVMVNKCQTFETRQSNASKCSKHISNICTVCCLIYLSIESYL